MVDDYCAAADIRLILYVEVNGGAFGWFRYHILRGMGGVR